MTKTQLQKLKRVFVNEYDIEIEKVVKANISKFNNDNIQLYHSKILRALNIKDIGTSKYYDYETFYKFIVNISKKVFSTKNEEE